MDGIVGVVLGVYLALRQYQEKERPRPWWRRAFER
jgi:hypothetical protein